MGTIPPFFIVVFIAIVGIAIFAFLRDQRVKGELCEHGVTITARVTNRYHDVQTSTDNDNHTTTTTDYYYITYQYTVNDAPYISREGVSLETYNILREGQPVEIVYLPENPGEARLASSL